MTASTHHAAADAAPSGACARAALAVIVVFLVLRLALSALLPLIADEAYAVVVSRFPTLSYYDHPPLAFGFARLAAWLFGSEASFVVRLPHVVLGSLSAWLLFLVARRAFDERAGFWAVAWYSVAPFFLASAGHFVVPDGPLNFFLLLALWLVLPDLIGDGRPDLRRWLAAGLALGLALLSKYTAGLFGVGAALLMLSDARGRRRLASPPPWAAAIVAVLCLAPVIAWNVQNDWVSFAFQSGRAAGGDFNAANFLLVQLGQAGFLLPWIWAPAIYLMLRGLVWPRLPAERVFAVLALLPVLAFDVVAMFGREILPHWSMPGFLFAFPLVGLATARLAAARPRLARTAFLASGLLVAALALVGVRQAQDAAVTRALDLPPRTDFDWTALRWDALERDFAQRGLLDDPDAFLVPVTWLVGGKAGYAVGPEMPVAEPLIDPRHFAFGRDPRLDGRTEGYAVFAAWPDDADRAAADLRRLAGERYALAGSGWQVVQMRGGRPSFVVVVQPVAPR